MAAGLKIKGHENIGECRQHVAQPLGPWTDTMPKSGERTRRGRVGRPLNWKTILDQEEMLRQCKINSRRRESSLQNEIELGDHGRPNLEAVSSISKIDWLLTISTAYAYFPEKDLVGSHYQRHSYICSLHSVGRLFLCALRS